MKRYLFLLFLFLILSCNDERNIEGIWYYNYLSETSSSNQVPESIIFRNDSIIFNYPRFDFLEKHSVKIEKSHLHFSDFKISFKVIVDTIIINEKQKFTRIPLEPFAKDYIENKPDIKIDLPQINGNNFLLNKVIKYDAFFKYYGIRPEMNNFSLLINDIYTNNFDDYLKSYGGSFHSSPIDYLFIDSDTKMIDLEKIFMASKFMNQLKVIFVNDVEVSFNKANGIFYKHFTLRKNFSPQQYNMRYYNLLIDKLELPKNIPPPPPAPPKVNGTDYPKALVIELKKNDLFIQNNKLKMNELINILTNNIEYNTPIISLYDFDSNYSSFLNLNVTIYAIWNQKRQELSLKRFNKSYSELNDKDVLEIKKEIPLLHIWDYSIPHFKEVIKEDGTFFGFRLN